MDFLQYISWILFILVIASGSCHGEECNLPEAAITGQVDDVCYGLYNEGVSSWGAAEAKCSTIDGNLAKVEDVKVAKMVEDWMKDVQLTNVWIGGKEFNTEWEWNDNTLLGNFNAWGPEMPRNRRGFRENCVHVDVRSGYKWIQKPCAFPNGYICEVEIGHKACLKDSTTDIAIHNGACYVIKYGNQTWFQANTQCKKWNGSLAKIVNQDQQDAIASTAISKETVNGFWIGLRKKKWLWVEGGEMAEDLDLWEANEPIDPGECLRFHHFYMRGFYWASADCNEGMAHVCQKVMATPAAQNPTVGALNKDTGETKDSGAKKNGKPGRTLGLVILFIFLLIVLTVIGVFICCYFRKRMKMKKKGQRDAEQAKAENEAKTNGNAMHYTNGAFDYDTLGSGYNGSASTVSGSKSDMNGNGTKHEDDPKTDNKILSNGTAPDVRADGDIGPDGKEPTQEEKASTGGLFSVGSWKHVSKFANMSGRRSERKKKKDKSEQDGVVEEESEHIEQENRNEKSVSYEIPVDDSGDYTESSDNKNEEYAYDQEGDHDPSDFDSSGRGLDDSMGKSGPKSFKRAMNKLQIKQSFEEKKPIVDHMEGTAQDSSSGERETGSMVPQLTESTVMSFMSEVEKLKTSKGLNKEGRQRTKSEGGGGARSRAKTARPGKRTKANSGDRSRKPSTGASDTDNGLGDTHNSVMSVISNTRPSTTKKKGDSAHGTSKLPRPHKSSTKRNSNIPANIPERHKHCFDNAAGQKRHSENDDGAPGFIFQEVPSAIKLEEGTLNLDDYYGDETYDV